MVSITEQHVRHHFTDVGWLDCRSGGMVSIIHHSLPESIQSVDGPFVDQSTKRIHPHRGPTERVQPQTKPSSVAGGYLLPSVDRVQQTFTIPSWSPTRTVCNIKPVRQRKNTLSNHV